MANEVNEGSDKVERINRCDRTSENTSKDSIIGGFRKDHQQIHQEAFKAGQTFETFSDNDNDQSFKAIQPAAESFGIDFGDGTIETAKGIVSKPTPQDAFEQKGQEILAAAQRLKPSSPDSLLLGGQSYEPGQLIAANMTSNPTVVSNATLPNLDEVKDSKLPSDATDETPEAITAWDPKKAYQDVRQHGLRTDIVRVAQPPRVDLKGVENGIKHAFKAGMDALPGNNFSVESFMHERPALAQAAELSPTLKALLSEQVPWSDKLIVNYKWQSAFTDFNLNDFSINMLKGWNNQKLIETFAHEMYHAKHQDLDKLYGSSPIPNAATYRDIKMNQEAGAFLQEYKVYEEVKSQFKDSKPVVFEYIDNAGNVQQKSVSELVVKISGQIDDDVSKAQIAKFLLSHDASQKQEDGSYKRNADGSLVRNSYKSLYEGERYQDYLVTFSIRQQELAPYLGKGY